jgi:hypothetical protein
LFRHCCFVDMDGAASIGWHKATKWIFLVGIFRATTVYITLGMAAQQKILTFSRLVTSAASASCRIPTRSRRFYDRILSISRCDYYAANFKWVSNTFTLKTWI